MRLWELFEDVENDLKREIGSCIAHSRGSGIESVSVEQIGADLKKQGMISDEETVEKMLDAMGHDVDSDGNVSMGGGGKPGGSIFDDDDDGPGGLPGPGGTGGPPAGGPGGGMGGPGRPPMGGGGPMGGPPGGPPGGGPMGGPPGGPPIRPRRWEARPRRWEGPDRRRPRTSTAASRRTAGRR